MSDVTKSRKKNQKTVFNQIIYPTLIMILFASVITGAIAAVTAFTQERIDLQANVKVQKSILSTLGIEATDDETIAKLYKDSITEEVYEDRKIYIATQNNKPLGFVFEMNGPALWGNVQGFFALSPDFSTLMGVEFVTHSETPGLGGRIDEPWYKEQFKTLKVPEVTAVSNSSSPIKPTAIYRPAEGGNIDGISGATLTANAVRDMINESIASAIQHFESFKSEKGAGQ